MIFFKVLEKYQRDEKRWVNRHYHLGPLEGSSILLVLILNPLAKQRLISKTKVCEVYIKREQNPSCVYHQKNIS